MLCLCRCEKHFSVFFFSSSTSPALCGLGAMKKKCCEKRVIKRLNCSPFSMTFSGLLWLLLSTDNSFLQKHCREIAVLDAKKKIQAMRHFMFQNFYRPWRMCNQKGRKIRLISSRRERKREKEGEREKNKIYEKKCYVWNNLREAEKKRGKLYIHMLMVDGRIWIFLLHFSSPSYHSTKALPLHPLWKCKFIFMVI